jgi:hypothetical protein
MFRISWPATCPSGHTRSMASNPLSVISNAYLSGGAQPKGATMKKPRRKAVHVPKVCSRCRRRLPYRALMASMACLDDGFIQGTVCADCLTPEECGHMAWLEATSECALNTDGRILVRDKFRAPTG